MTEAEANQDGYNTEATGDTGTVPDGGTASARFVNEKPDHLPANKDDGNGDLDVTKTVTGKDGDRDRDWHFRVELDDRSINGTYGGMTFKDGVAEFTLKDDQTASASGLPEGTEYTVTEKEADQDGYKTISHGTEGTVDADGNATAEFVNHRNTPDHPDKPDEPNPPDRVKTDDSGHVWLWASVLAAAVFGAAAAGAALLRGRRRSRK